MSRPMHERLKFTSEKDRELFCGLATPSDVQELIDTIERLTKERDELSKRLERMHRPRCYGYSDDPTMGWPLLENPCQFCGARQGTDACRDMADAADCDKIRAERDPALAEVERWRAKFSEIEEIHQKTFDDLAAARAEVERLKLKGTYAQVRQWNQDLSK